MVRRPRRQVIVISGICIVGYAAVATTIASYFERGYGNRKRGDNVTDGELDGMCAGVGARIIWPCQARGAVEGCDDGGILAHGKHASLRGPLLGWHTVRG